MIGKPELKKGDAAPLNGSIKPIKMALNAAFMMVSLGMLGKLSKDVINVLDNTAKLTNKPGSSFKAPSFLSSPKLGM